MKLSPALWHAEMCRVPQHKTLSGIYLLFFPTPNAAGQLRACWYKRTRFNCVVVLYSSSSELLV